MFEAVIVDVARTPIGKRNGALKDTHPVDLLSHVLRSLLERHSFAPERIDDVIVGCVDQIDEQAINIGRNAWLSAGLPESVPAVTLDRQCGSSLQALHFAAQGVMAGAYDLVIAAGVESMTRVPMLQTFSESRSPLTRDLSKRYSMQSGWFNQAVGAELIARQYGLSRLELDEFGYRSHQLAFAAQKEGKFNEEIIPVPIMKEGQPVLFTQDEGIRHETSVAKMATLKPAFPDLELITAGNASQISDGASAVLIASKETAKQLGLKPLARFVSFAVVGVDPITMLTGPIPATQKVLQRASLTVDDIDLFEVNEAFASVVLAWQKETGAPLERVNVSGGAIALGHPLGATGTRIAATLVSALQREKKRYGLIAICEGGGMANATILERL
ncbi:thiolase family protein [Sulfoacidibacillus thermotolerans]|uniref:Acetyl-CoA acetyltransferase n=1 Tax=Sulfoacidibacillus thermotolerans TaxID=1765684 RepID=A0A2U3DAI4_SULT2|nr:thiolase family protein [Sulfoacidibacillus thermotolerans]PWI58294.1 acetyl-CoA acetyltransferase [Sulfoacidibacillus thermotolerans]